MSNQPPIEVPQGAIRLNTDSQKLEFYAQDRWFEMATDVPTLDGGVRGIFFGGTNGSNVDDIEFITISTQGNASDFGNMTTSGHVAAGTCASNTRGLVAGGAPSVTDTIEFVTISSTGNGTDFGNLTDGRDFLGGLSNQTRGCFNGGRIVTPGTKTNIIDFVTIATLGNAIDFGDTRNIHGNYPMMCASPTRGIIGGAISPTLTDIDFITIATTGNGQDFGDATVNQGGVGVSNSVRGLFAGGYNPSLTSNISFITIATFGNSTTFGDLTVARRGPGAAASSVRATFAGGQISASPNNTNIIDYVAIATTGDAVDFGDLGQSSSGQKRNVSGCSNGHGGL